MIASDISQWALPTGVAGAITTLGASAWKYATDRAARKNKEQADERKAREAQIISEREYTANAQARVDKKMDGLIDRLDHDVREYGEQLDRLREKTEKLERENVEQRSMITIYTYEIAALKSRNLELQNEVTALRLEVAELRQRRTQE